VTRNIPTKTLRETALYLTGFRRRDTYGLSLQLLPSLALERLLARTAEVIATRTASVRANLDRQEVQLLRGQARLGPDRSVIVRSEDGSERALHASVGLPDGYRGAAGALLAALDVDLEELREAVSAELREPVS
jgi:NAD(P) transhydrogenase